MATYYISTTGSNSNNGTSTATPWQTIAKVNATTFAAGDSILFKRGETWREKLTISSSGSGSGYITFGSYGTGNKPKILGSTQAVTWVAEGHTNIWVSSTVLQDPASLGMTGSDIFYDNNGVITQGLHKAYSSTFSNLTSEYNWTWYNNRIYIYSPSFPSTRYTSVEVPQLDWGISINEKEYITIDGFEIRFSCSGGITTASYPTANKSYLIIKNCDISYSGLIIPNTTNDKDNYGIHACYSHMLLQNNTIHDLGRRSISVYNYGYGFTVVDITIEGNILYNGYHTTGIDISCGSGGAGSADFDGIVIRNNLVYDAANAYNYGSELFNIESYYTVGVNIHNVLIYNNILKYPQNSGIHIYGIHGAGIYNNTFYGHNETAAGNTAHIKIQNECTGVVIKNNIFYTALSVESSSRGNAIYTPTSQTTTSITADYNIYYRTDQTFRIIELRDGASIYDMNQLVSIRSVLGWEIHGQTSNPLFISTLDYHLQSNSPAIGAGVKIPIVVTDFSGNTFANPPSLGVYEYNIGVTTTLAPTTTSAPTTTLVHTTTLAPTTTVLPTTTIAPTTTAVPPSIAPHGWHVPSREEYTTLFNYLGSTTEAGGHMKEAGTVHWSAPNTGADNSSGFTALPTGVRGSDGAFVGAGFITEFYTNSEFTDPSRIYCVGLSYDTEAGLYDNVSKNSGVALRLIKDHTTLTNGQTSVMVDIDNNTYPTICIGTQEWMAENLNVTRMNDGTPIPNVSSNVDWSALSTPGYCAVSV